MSRDPIVDEVRSIRAGIAQEHGNDLKAIIAGLKLKEGTDGRRVVSLAAGAVRRAPAQQNAVRLRPDARSRDPKSAPAKHRHA
jgi:arginase family enzyme